MIPRSLVPQQPPRWQTLLASAISDPHELLRLLGLPGDLLPNAIRASAQFRLRVPRGYLSRIRKGDPDDPLLRQVLPLGQELDTVPGYSRDPLAEADAMPAPGVLHKYQGRVLLTLTGACAVHCRYCFRRHYPYGDANPVAEHWSQTYQYLQSRRDVDEVILSGGDPLNLSDTRLAALVDALDSVPHLQRLRIHSRIPVVLPERVDADLLDWLRATRLGVVLVIHCNHPNELDSSVGQAMRQLRDAGVILLNQSVLLRGVNDSPDILVHLSRKLFDVGVLPYYLHQLDAVQGAAHFAVDDAEARHFDAIMRCRLPGYLVPKLVRELPGELSKIQLSI
jgi:EF-P beta-lysylation protein EpmB